MNVLHAVSVVGLALALSAPTQAAEREGTEVSDGILASDGIGFSTAAGFDFHPSSNTTEYVKGPSFLVLNGGLISLSAGAGFEAQLEMPQNARLRWLDTFGLHDDDQDLEVALLRRCHPVLTGGNATQTTLVTALVGDQDGQFVRQSGVPGVVLVDNRLCTYHVRLVFGDSGGSAAGVLMQVAKVRVEWRDDLIFADGFEF